MKLLCVFCLSVIWPLCMSRGPLFSGHKDQDDDGDDVDQGTEGSDGCVREYPLTAKNEKLVPLAFNRYAITPGLIPEPPVEYVEVS